MAIEQASKTVESRVYALRLPARVGRPLPLMLAAFCLLSAMSSEALAGFPKSPHYPVYHYPSVLDAPRGYGPFPTYGFAGPSYRWGWFGVQYYPRMVHHTGSQNDYMQTGFRWGY